MTAPPAERLVTLDLLADAAVVGVRAGVDAGVTGELRAALTAAVDGPGHVVLDLGDAPTVDPAGLALIVRAHRRARRRGTVLCLAAPSRYVVTVLHTMRLGGLFPTFADRPSALHWLRTLP
ncbi:STAS domain-containing protein [Spirilliplanes yamanashiensis]|uniref:STAS domain-containing protein n=1 Tax=Spirilliplanes yamanashiensis TaxID=42233 RepID=A0A8J3Y7R0_9ACTN|nr:STAS domain-containing protein [Spirilliplanes yamanashiensis]MDP9817495.1 anti-sigma B factor antagonist [Spirilliplanes yamanashiensis]GIJ02852.1 hypothetical protein Sya03_22040 [Spirilliplanes yamanashiensis]